VDSRLNFGGRTTIPIDEKENVMTKTLSLVSLAVISVTLGAQTTTSPQTPDPTMTPGTTQTQTQQQSATDAQTPAQSARTAQVEAANVNAELTKNLDAKRAHVGDQVEARTTSEAKLADGTTLPRGTKLVGNVLDVTAKSKQANNSRLVIALNRAVMKDGKQVAIQSAVTSITAPVSSSDAAVVSMPSGPPASAGASGGASGSAPAAAPSAPTIGRETASDTQSPTQGQVLKSAGDQVPVGNKPRILLSAPNTPESSGILEAQGENVSLQSGTKFTLNIIPAQA
jgi:hypothetical protein